MALFDQRTQPFRHHAAAGPDFIGVIRVAEFNRHFDTFARRFFIGINDFHRYVDRSRQLLDLTNDFLAMVHKFIF